MRTLAVGVLVLLALLAAPAAAQEPMVERAADALRSEPVHVDPAAELAGRVDAGAIQARIQARDAGRMYIAVLPSSASPDGAERTLLALRDDVGEPGAYAVMVGDELRTLPAGEVVSRPADPQAALIAFVDRTAAERERAPEPNPSGSIVALAILLVVSAAGGAVMLTRRRRRSA